MKPLYGEALLQQTLPLLPGSEEETGMYSTLVEKAKLASAKVYHKHLKDDWETPDALYKLLHAEFQFNLDACATEQNAKAPLYLTPEMNALTTAWNIYGPDTVAFMNPPYSKVRKFCQRAAAQAELHSMIVVGLLAARVDTRWWWESCVAAASEIRFLKGRLTFKGAAANAPFPSAVVVWDSSYHSATTSWCDWKTQAKTLGLLVPEPTDAVPF